MQPPSEKNKKVVVTFHIDPRTLAFEKKDGGMEFAKLSCTVWAYGKDIIFMARVERFQIAVKKFPRHLRVERLL